MGNPTLPGERTRGLFGHLGLTERPPVPRHDLEDQRNFKEVIVCTFRRPVKEVARSTDHATSGAVVSLCSIACMTAPGSSNQSLVRTNTTFQPKLRNSRGRRTSRSNRLAF